MIKNIFKRIFFGMLSLFPRTLNGVSVLMYHSVGTNKAFFTVSPREFEAQMKLLAGYKQRFLFATDVVREVRSGNVQPGICVTFDDGYADNIEIALPILEKYSIPATFFVATGFVDKSLETSGGVEIPLVSKEMLEKFASHPLVEFLPHSVHHQKHVELSDIQIQEEVIHSRTYLEEFTRTDCRVYAYPKGSYDERVIEALEREGILGAFSVTPGIVGNESYIYALPRNSIDSTTGMSGFKVKLSDRIDMYEKLKNVLRA